MKRIEAVQIKNSPAIADYLVKEIGRINIVCGKNNSGKSKLLEAILSSLRDKKVRSISRTFSSGINIGLLQDYISFIHDEEADEKYIIFYNNSSAAITLEENYAKRIVNALDQFVDNFRERLWGKEEFKDQFFRYVVRNTTFQLYDRDENGIPYHEDQEVDEHNLVYIVNCLFDFDGVAKLIPAKRNPSTQISIIDFEKEKQIIKYLFESKGMLKTSARYKRYQRLAEDFKRLSDGVEFDVVIENNNIALVFLNRNFEWIKAEDSGLGLRDLLYLIAYIVLLDLDVLLIEEPESHWHPDLQRKFLHYLKYETDKQYIISTHSNVFLDTTFVDKVLYTSFLDKIVVSDETNKAIILQDMGYTTFDNLFADLLILVEGKTDVPIFEEFLIKYNNLWNDYNIKILPLGGITNMPHIDLKVLVGNYNKVMGVVDGDLNLESVKARSAFESNCVANGVIYKHLSGYGIENYLSLNALKSTYGSSVPVTLSSINLGVKLELQIPKHNKNDNRDIANKMSLKEIELTGDLYVTLQEIGEICKDLPKKV